MSREFFRNIIPNSRKNNTIDELKSNMNWDKPPKKEDPPVRTSTKVADEAAKYFEHLAQPYTPRDPAHARKINKAQNTLIEELRKWGVDKVTSDTVGRDIEQEEIIKICAHLPEGKSPGPDRIPNIFSKITPSCWPRF